MANEYFPGIGRIPFEGTKSMNPMAFHYYDADKVVLGKKMKDWLKFALAWWHTLGQASGDQFGGQTRHYAWDEGECPICRAKAKVDAGFEIMQKLGIEYFCFHDIDLIEEGETIEEYEERIQNGEEMNFRNSDILLYRILEKLMTESVYLLRKVGLDVELINRELLQEKQVKIIERISVTRKNLILINTIFKPQLRLFHLFETGKVTGFTDDVEYMEDYWGNILDYLQKVWDMTEDYEELIEGLSMTFDSMQTNKTNETMKILTLVSTIILPLTFITGLYGMNVALPFQEAAWAFWGIMGFMAVVAAAFYIYFRHKKMM